MADNPLASKTVQRFVAGAGLTDAVSAAVDLNTQGIGGILDLLGEGVTDLAGASDATKQYQQAVDPIADRGIDATVSLKLSQLGLMVDREACAANLTRILDRAKQLGVGVEVDMEQSDLVEATLEVFREVAAGTRTPGWPSRPACAARRGPGVVGGSSHGSGWSRAPTPSRSNVALRSQVRDHRAVPVPDRLAVRARQSPGLRYPRQRRASTTPRRPRPRRAREAGLRDPDAVRHPAGSAARVGADGYRVRVYIPFGSAWYPYLMRRMAERPANLLFFLRSLVGG